MSELPSRADFELAYSRRAPWDIATPQAAFLDVIPALALEVIDLGCGTGELALHVAATGRKVIAIDYVEEPIQRARQKGKERGIACDFRVMDALRVSELGKKFGSVLDCGLFHVFSDSERQEYVYQLSNVVFPWGRLFFLVFSTEEPGTHGPRRMSAEEFETAFCGPAWRLDSIRKCRFQVRTDIQRWTFSEGGPHALFAEVTRLPT